MPNKILICDDEEGVRESLKLILGDFYDLVVIEDPESLPDVLSRNKDITLTLLNVEMRDALTTIKKKLPLLNVIMITGYKSIKIAEEATKIGACGYITKPFKSEEILEKIKKLMK
jgi:DNA-binding NtrC family response regulator